MINFNCQFDEITNVFLGLKSLTHAYVSDDVQQVATESPHLEVKRITLISVLVTYAPLWPNTQQK